MDSPAGIVALAIVVVWLAYFVPGKLAGKGRVAAARVDDRFSENLRVLAVAGGAKVDAGPHGDCDRAAPRASQLLPVPKPGEREVFMTQPEFTQAQRRLAEQRRQQARRRALITAVLGAALVVLVPVVFLTPVHAVVLIAPALLLTGVLVLGRRAVVSQQRADEEIARRARVAHRAAIANRIAGTGAGHRVGRPVPVAKPRTAEQRTVAASTGLDWSASVEEVLERVDARRAAQDSSATEAERVAAETVESRAEVPAARAEAEVARRVPRPTYATKAAAPKWEPAPMSAEIERASRTMAAWDAEHAGDIEIDYVPSEASVTDQGASALGSLTLDGVLERRRAAG
ncbi:hypothetical protein GCM10010401_05130 [Rarobacter faecitabidus]|uniref:Uncharacterized protein n=1 Tax=Rarobacter faecitabidus TaxID=13243 RepID=A0A542ZTZ4_RARFA|nr:hypothetical protein [Rarobacter faecitabidus]TQL63736.1 hypothetical protein FB461_0207 [Rarobacter faecitabidus]